MGTDDTMVAFNKEKRMVALKITTRADLEFYEWIIHGNLVGMAQSKQEKFLNHGVKYKWDQVVH